MQDDQTQPTPRDGRERTRHFELPEVHELRPVPDQRPAAAAAADGSPSSSRGRVMRSEDDAATDDPLAAGLRLRDTFQRRWEQVQARFVDQAARRLDLTDD